MTQNQTGRQININLTNPTVIPAGISFPIGETLPVAIQRIAQTLNPEKIILFGSFAYGDPTSDSDVDLLVIMETDEPDKERSWVVSRLLLPRQFPVDILVKTPKEIKKAIAKNDSFVREILTRGMILYERSQ